MYFKTLWINKKNNPIEEYLKNVELYKESGKCRFQQDSFSGPSVWEGKKLVWNIKFCRSCGTEETFSDF